MKLCETRSLILSLTALLTALACASSSWAQAKTKMLSEVNAQISSRQAKIAQLDTESATLQDKCTTLESQLQELKTKMDSRSVAIKEMREQVTTIENDLLRSMAEGADILEKERLLNADNNRLGMMRDKLLKPIKQTADYQKLLREREDKHYDLELARGGSDGAEVTRKTEAVMAVDKKIADYEAKQLEENTEYVELMQDVANRRAEITAIRAKMLETLRNDPQWTTLTKAMESEQKALFDDSAANRKLTSEMQRARAGIERNNNEISQLNRQIATLDVRRKQLEIALQHDLVGDRN